MLEQLERYGWQDAFADEPNTTSDCNKEVNAIGCLDTPFSRKDVAEILAIHDGENDEENWVGIFRLHDGRFAAVSAWCDYTGFG